MNWFDIIKSFFKNISKALLHGAKAIFYLIQTKYFWKSIVTTLFVKLFWEGLASTIIFILMIPAMLSGDLPIWLGIALAITMGSVSKIISTTYDSVNPVRGLFHKMKKKNDK